MHTTLGTYVEQISKRISWWKKVNLFNKRFGETRHSCVEKWNSIHISLLLSKNSSLSGINIELWNFKVARRKHRTLKIMLKAITFWKKNLQEYEKEVWDLKTILHSLQTSEESRKLEPKRIDSLKHGRQTLFTIHQIGGW